MSIALRNRREAYDQIEPKRPNRKAISVKTVCVIRVRLSYWSISNSAHTIVSTVIGRQSRTNRRSITYALADKLYQILFLQTRMGIDF